jgi:hypothetical protein
VTVAPAGETSAATNAISPPGDQKLTSGQPKLVFKPSALETPGKKYTTPKKLQGVVGALHALDGGSTADIGKLRKAWSGLLGIEEATLRSEMQVAGQNCTGDWMHATVTGAVLCLEGVLSEAFEKAQSFVRTLDPESSNWEDGEMREVIEATLVEGVRASGVAEVAEVNVRLMHVLCDLAESNGFRNIVSPTVFKSGEFNLTLRLLFSASWRGDAVVGGNASSGGLPTWLFDSVLGALQLNRSCAVTLDGSTKAFLVHGALLKAAAGQGGDVARKVTLTITREDALRESLAILLREGMVPSVESTGAKGGACIVTPYFRSAAGVEEGEGHGPRKELFALVARQFCDVWAMEEDGPCLLSGEVGQRVLHGANLDSCVREGYRIRLRRAGDPETEGTVEAVVESIADDGQSVSVSEPLPATVTKVNFTLAEPTQPLMVYKQGSESYWPNEMLMESAELKQQYLYLGWLLGTSMLNRSHLDIRFPRPWLAQLMATKVEKPVSVKKSVGGTSMPPSQWEVFSPTLDDLKAIDESLLQTVAQVEGMSDKDLRAMILEADDLPPTATKDAYLAYMMYELTVECVQWQTDAVRNGLTASLGVVGRAALQEAMVDVHDLAELISGPRIAENEDFDVRRVYRLVPPGEASDFPDFMPAFWAVVDAWPPAQKRRFLLFVTGVDRLPAPGSEDLVVELPFVAYGLEGHRKTLMTLPQAHTCSNTLELPNYAEALSALVVAGEVPPGDVNQRLRAVIEEKLGMAVADCSGYGLDFTSDDQSPAPARAMAAPLSPAAARVSTNQVVKETPLRKSSSSLHIPELGDVTHSHDDLDDMMDTLLADDL